METRVHATALLIAALAGSAAAGPKFNFNEGKSSLEITQTYQIWGAIMPSLDNTPETGTRADLYLRRGQLGFKGQVMPDLTYSTIFSFDNVGKDPYAGTTNGSGQDLNATRIQFFEGWMAYSLDTNLATMTFGYFRPQASREFNGSFAAISSLDYSIANTYFRQHITTRGAGRETGANLGGQWSIPGTFGILYQVGGFDAVQEKAKTNADLRGHRIWSPLWTGRLAMTLGDMENPKYAMKSTTQFFGKRTGITIAGFGTWQDQVSELFDTTTTTTTTGTTKKLTYAGGFDWNSTAGGDFLANWKGLSLSGEMSWLSRKGSIHPDSTPVQYTDKVWFLRGAYAVKLGDSLGYLEPAVMYSKFEGDTESLQNPKGEETQLDIGMNYYPTIKGVRLALHWVKPDGKAKSGYTKGAAKDGTEDPKNATIVAELRVQL